MATKEILNNSPVTKEELIARLTRIRNHLCAYNRHKADQDKIRPCDCKFGGRAIGDMAKEETGCPEILLAIEILQSLE